MIVKITGCILWYMVILYKWKFLQVANRLTTRLVHIMLKIDLATRFKKLCLNFSFLYVTWFAKTLQLHTFNFLSLTSHNFCYKWSIYLKLSHNISYLNVALQHLKIVKWHVAIQDQKLWFYKVVKLDVCNWRVFANQATYIFYFNFFFSLSKFQCFVDFIQNLDSHSAQ